MNSEKEANKSEKRIRELIVRGEINTKLSEMDSNKFVQFYLKQSEISLRTAVLLFEISTTKEEKEHHKLQQEFETFLWVINSAYYSMFYAVNAALASRNVKIKSEQGIHKTIAHAFFYFLIKNEQLAKRLFVDFSKAQQEAIGLLNIEEFEKKADILSKDLDYERSKRILFTYETTERIKQMTAQVSLERARNFFETVRIFAK